MSELEWYEIEAFRTPIEDEMATKRRGLQKGDLLRYKCRGKTPESMKRYEGVLVYMGKDIKKDHRGIKFVEHKVQVGRHLERLDASFMSQLTRIAKGNSNK